jgi:hypothetical protein
MTILLLVTLVWVVLVVLALVVALTAAAVFLHRARNRLRGIADDLELLAERAGPLAPVSAKVGSEAKELISSLVRADTALGRVSRLVTSLFPVKKG